MYSGLKLNIVATCVLVMCFASVANAQLASDKSLNVIYNKKINEKLDEKNKSRPLSKPLQKEQNLPSTRSSLNDVAKLKIKNREVVTHSNSIKSDEENRNKLASNSPTLKEMGIQAARSKKLPAH